MMDTSKNTRRCRADAIIVGGGMVGAACAWALSEYLHVVLLEAEDIFGYHATGRSAALYTEYFGDPITLLLTRGSRQFFQNPSDDIAQHDLLRHRGTVALATVEEQEKGVIDAALAAGDQAETPASLIDLKEVKNLCPILELREFDCAIYRPSTWDIDVAALHEGFLRVARSRGAEMFSGARLNSLTFAQGMWTARSDSRIQCNEWQAPIVVNAAGAWADEVARLAGVRPLGLIPKRRTIARIDLPPKFTSHSPDDWPMINDLADTFYFKPENCGLLLCPCDATPSVPCDAQPEELDVAVAVSNLERVTCLEVTHITNKWAGLRTYTSDQKPVLGQAHDVEKFFWAAGLGGTGIQTAPAVGRALASLVVDGDVPDDLSLLGLTRNDLCSSRLYQA